MKKQKTMGNKGFSLVELIVVIAIMAVLVGVLAPQFIKYVESSKQSTDIQNVQQLKTAIEVQIVDMGTDASKTVPATVTITIKDNKATSSINLDSTSQEVTLKSNGWGEIVYTYTTATTTWSNAEHKNTNKPERDMNEIFK